MANVRLWCMTSDSRHDDRANYAGSKSAEFFTLRNTVKCKTSADYKPVSGRENDNYYTQTMQASSDRLLTVNCFTD